MEMKSEYTIDVDPDVFRELQYMVELFKKHGSLCPVQNVSGLIAYILASIADGSRRPGAWERQLLTILGLVAHCPEHHTYRGHYGSPD
ncbi:hypothetical protein [Erwinia oleae]|uniref:hypothetical protein n=1 Tax=Erwinia oleae TaxID=796334 RepID=UPI001F17788A|nr:hypothetical protein [Erwinia oleae]